MKKVSLKSFLPILIMILIIIPVVYFVFIRPQIDSCSIPVNPCSISYDCVCESVCTCKYQDEKGEVNDIVCDKE